MHLTVDAVAHIVQVGSRELLVALQLLRHVCAAILTVGNGVQHDAAVVAVLRTGTGAVLGSRLAEVS